MFSEINSDIIEWKENIIKRNKTHDTPEIFKAEQKIFIRKNIRQTYSNKLKSGNFVITDTVN